MQQLKAAIADMQKQTDALSSQISKKDEDKNAIRAVESKLMERIRELGEMCTSKDQTITQLQNQLSESRTKGAAADELLATVNSEIIKLQKINQKTEETNSQLSVSLEGKIHQLENLNLEINNSKKESQLNKAEMLK